MTSADCGMPGCDRPAHEAYVCTWHADWAERDLGDVPALLDELETTRTRQARIGEPGRGSGDSPLPWHEAASAAEHALTAAVTALTRHVAAERGMDVPVAGAEPAAAVSARWLLAVRAVEWLRHRPEAAETFQALSGAVGDARHAIDRRADRRYAGPCSEPTDQVVGGCPCVCHGASPGTPCSEAGGCGLEWHRPVPCRGELYARPDAETVTCDVCGAEFDVTTRRAWLLASAKDELASAAQIASLLAARQDPVEVAKLAAKIRKWAERGRLLPRAWSAWGRNAEEAEDRQHPRYRVGDVQELLREAAEAEARGQAKATA